MLIRAIEELFRANMDAHQVISTILRHDRKQNSYKIALLRAIGDVALEFSSLQEQGRDVAVPLRLLAEHWIAYFWPFVGDQPIWQGHRQQKKSGLSQDMSFRPALTELRREWEAVAVDSRPSDGFFLIHEMRLARRRRSYPESLKKAYGAAWRKIKGAIKYPIRYAGPGNWQVFERPRTLRGMDRPVAAVPETKANELCLVVSSRLWRTFCDLSLWVEALCVHEWSLFTETVDQWGSGPVERGAAYQLLTARPDNRRPLTWERNQVDLLMMEGKTFTCPWTRKPLGQGADYDLDHLLPLSVYPVNELWNLVPANPAFNQHRKRDRLPSEERLAEARPHLQSTYDSYMASPELARAMEEDVAVRFAVLDDAELPSYAADAAVQFIDRVASARNLERF